MIPRPLQVGATEQQHPMGTRQAGQPQMATRDRAATDGDPNLRSGGTGATASSITA